MPIHLMTRRQIFTEMALAGVRLHDVATAGI